MPSEPGAEASLSVRNHPSTPRGEQVPQMEPRKQTIHGSNLDNFSRRLLGYGIAALLAIGALKGGQQIITNEQRSTDTGYVPNQPGLVETPKPTATPSLETTIPAAEGMSQQEQDAINAWAQTVREKLNGGDLGDGEKIVHKINVISIGDGAPGANVRPYPNSLIGTGNILTRRIEEVPVLAKLQFGSVIQGPALSFSHHFIDHGRDTVVNFFAFKAGSVTQGGFINDQGERVALPPNEIIVAAHPYLQPVHAGPGSNPH